MEKAFKKADHELHDLRNKHELVLVELQNTDKHWKETAAQVHISKTFIAKSSI